ncbi:acyl--CoA ligase [Leucobacter sp. UCMA 4100]|uniref:class I adenylate-forming enzyme family protein n=1 Tax=Leucobacter sp. UCMA 4100 TaxID=2810534 RepID=UPI0022EB1077|nr:class I adenylate-forming enzyme family protein [Leucobacter sp. UCMA 4100]MDA3146048.1 acyl--CoA ligase [Leucobacter sp. UCMA 4100]
MMPTSTMPTFAALWSDSVQRYAKHPFLLFHDREGSVTEWSYEAFGHVVDDTAATLTAAGVGPGSAIHVCLRNSPGFIAVWLAAAKLGAWIIPVDPASSPRDIATQVARVRPVVGVCAAQHAAVYREGIADFGPLPVLELDESASDVQRPAGVLVAPLPGESDDDGQRLSGAAVVQPDERLAVMFTSGTTSQPKGVVLTQENYRVVASEMAEAAGLMAGHRWFVTLPLFHANAQFYCFASAIERGASVALTATFSASRWITQARALGVTHASLFAAPIRMILAKTSPGTEPLSLKHVWFAQNLGEQHHTEFGALAGVLPRQLYGMTETLAVVTYDRSQPAKAQEIGKPLGGRTVRLVAPGTLDDVERGTPGVMAVQGTPGRDIFACYLDDPETTARTLIRDPKGQTWLMTGDLAVSDEQGALSFVGRVDDVIKVSGENVSLTEVEAVLAQAPGVLEVAVVAVDDPVRDVVPHAYLVPKDPTLPLETERIAEWAAANLAPAARPREWHVIDELPRTSVGKVRRFKVGA